MKILHNPRCSKSRETLQILQQQGHEPEIVQYLKTPPSPKELESILTTLGLEPRQLMRTNEAEYQQFFADTSLSRAALVEKMCQHPQVIERPIVLYQDKAIIGRPPIAVLEIL